MAVTDSGVVMFTVVEPAMHPAEFGNLAARHNLVEIAEACRRGLNGFTGNELSLWIIA